MQYPLENQSPRMVMSIAQVADALGLSKGKVYQLVRREGLPVVPFGRVLRIRPDALQKWLQERERNC